MSDELEVYNKCSRPFHNEIRLPLSFSRKRNNIDKSTKKNQLKSRRTNNTVAKRCLLFAFVFLFIFVLFLSFRNFNSKLSRYEDQVRVKVSVVAGPEKQSLRSCVHIKARNINSLKIQQNGLHLHLMYSNKVGSLLSVR